MDSAARIVTVVVSALLLAGCDGLELASDADPGPRPKAQTSETGDSHFIAKAAVQADKSADGGTAVENALIWLEKYSKASERIVQLQQENHKMAEDNDKLKSQLSKTQVELSRTQKELSEANTMLMEMRAELEKWKANVLGFRQEMLEAREVELDAMKRILRLLGGEVPPQKAPPQKPEPASRSATSAPAK